MKPKTLYSSNSERNLCTSICTDLNHNFPTTKFISERLPSYHQLLKELDNWKGIVIECKAVVWMQNHSHDFTYPIQMFSAGVRNRSFKDNLCWKSKKIQKHIWCKWFRSIYLHLWVVPLAGQISSTLWSAKRNCYETNLDIANHGMGIQDRWLQFKLSQEWHQWLNICHPILLCQLYHTHTPQPGTNHPHPFFSVQKFLAWPSASSRFIKAQHKQQPNNKICNHE